MKDYSYHLIFKIKKLMEVMHKKKKGMLEKIMKLISLMNILTTYIVSIQIEDLKNGKLLKGNLMI